jgi:polysaccharide export outer membrane protein
MKVRKLFAVLFLFVWALPAAYAQQRLDTAEDANERIRLLATMHTRQGDYVIGGGDLLQIQVFDVPDLSRDVRISDSGYFSLPLLPTRIRASGLTSFQLEEKLVELLQVNGLVSQPHVTVFVKEPRSRNITVIGAVKKPQVIQALRETTLLEALSHTEGLTPDAGSVVLITRPAQPATEGDAETPAREAADSASISVALKDLLESGDPKYNVALQGGDVVSVPRAGVVYVVGAVRRPGGYTLKSDAETMTALKAVALAEGLGDFARPADAVVIRRDAETGKEKEFQVNLNHILSRKAEDFHLQADDILFVPDSVGKRAMRRTAEALIQITTGLVIWRR